MTIDDLDVHILGTTLWTDLTAQGTTWGRPGTVDANVYAGAHHPQLAPVTSGTLTCDDADSPQIHRPYEDEVSLFTQRFKTTISTSVSGETHATTWEGGQP